MLVLYKFVICKWFFEMTLRFDDLEMKDLYISDFLSAWGSVPLN